MKRKVEKFLDRLHLILNPGMRRTGFRNRGDIMDAGLPGPGEQSGRKRFTELLQEENPAPGNIRQEGTGQTDQYEEAAPGNRTNRGTFRTRNAMTQLNVILKWLHSGRELISTEAAESFGCHRLSARIYDLRREGYEIGSRRVRHTDGKYYTCYFLETAATGFTNPASRTIKA